MAPATVSDEEGERHRRKLLLLGLCAFFLIGAGVGVSLWMRAPQDQPGGDPFPAPKVVTAKPADTRAGELENELSFSRLMDILGMESDKPAIAPFTKPFVKAFTSNPETRKPFEEFKRKAALGQKPKAKDFLASMRAQPAFGRMVAELGRSPGGSAAMMSLAQHPELKRFLAEQDRLAKAGGGPASRDKGAAVALRPRAGGKGADGAAGTGAVLKSGGFAPNAAELAQLASVGPAIGAGGGSGTQGAGGAGGSGPDAHDATKLDKGWKDEKNITLSDDVKKLNKLLQQYPCLASLGQAKLLRFINGADIDRLGLWGACFQLKWFQDCRVTGCTPPVGEHPCWQSCLDANNDNERACIQKVRAQPGCGQGDIPADIWAANCVPKRNPATGKCVSSTPPIPECGLGSCIDDPALAESTPVTPTEQAAAAAKFASDPAEQAMREMTCNCTGQAAVDYEARMLHLQNDQGVDFNDSNYQGGNGLHYNSAGDWLGQTLRDSPENLDWVKTHDASLWERLVREHPELQGR